MRLFGYEIKRRADEPDKQLVSFAAPSNEDGAATIMPASGAYGTYLDLEGVVRTEAELVTKYREMELQPEVDFAVDDIVNEMIVQDDEENDPVEINLDKLEVEKNVKDAIRTEWDGVVRLLDLKRNAYNVVRRWFVDGRLHYHGIIDEKAPRDGLRELRYIDPRKIRKIREVERRKDPKSGAMLMVGSREFYVYRDQGFGAKKPGSTSYEGIGVQALKIARDTVLQVTSGLTDPSGQMVLSYLHKAIRPLNQLRAIEDASIVYKLTRAPERRIFYVDVAGLPRAKAEQVVQEAMRRHKNKVIYDPNNGCFTMDTRIPLLDGRTLTIAEIELELSEGRQPWVYSCDPKTGAVVPGLVTWAGVTRESAEVMRLTLDNGQSVVCTPDHKFPVWEKGFVEAKDIVVGESMMPLYRRDVPITKGANEYEQVFDNETREWEFTHRMVARWKDENGWRDEMIHDPSIEWSKTVVHHRNFDRHDNSPSNLTWMEWNDHIQYHAAHVDRLWGTSEIALKMRQSIADRCTIVYTDEVRELVRQCAELGLTAETTARTVTRSPAFGSWATLNADRLDRDFTPKDVGRVADDDWRGFKAINEVETTSRRGSAEWKAKLGHSKRGKVYHQKTWKVTAPSGETEIVENLSAFCRQHTAGLNRNNIKGEHGSRGYRAEELRNHKVVSIERLPEPMQVGTITVDGQELYHDHHTFALDIGIYTKNSVKDDRKFMTMTEDYWFPRRSDGKATEVTTLPGGQGLGDMEETVYFQRLLYRALGVPVTRMDPETTFNLGRSTEITRDEVKFGKFVDRLRRQFSNLFVACLERQVVLKNIFTPEEWSRYKHDISFKFARDGYFTELKELEIMQDRGNALSMFDNFAGRYVSHETLRRKILRQSDEDIEVEDARMKNEVDDPRYQDPAAAMGTEPLEPGQVPPPPPSKSFRPAIGPSDAEMEVRRTKKIDTIET
jgi:hypothetical protein